jgi:sialic acid synthase SpsE
LWCLSKYPCEPKDLKNLPKNFNNSLYDGYSDHSIGIETCLIAIARGAKIIEKHFTLDKSNTTIRDHALSATPDEFRLLANLGKDISKKIDIGV